MSGLAADPKNQAVSAEEVQELLDELQEVLDGLLEKIAQDEEKKNLLQRNLVQYADDLEDLDALLDKQRKLYKSLVLSLDETESALVQLNNAAGTFKGQVGKITRKDMMQ